MLLWQKVDLDKFDHYLTKFIWLVRTLEITSIFCDRSRLMFFNGNRVSIRHDSESPKVCCYKSMQM